MNSLLRFTSSTDCKDVLNMIVCLVLILSLFLGVLLIGGVSGKKLKYSAGILWLVLNGLLKVRLLTFGWGGSGGFYSNSFT